MKRVVQDYTYLALIAGLIIAIDQITKFWIRHTLNLGEIYRPDLWFTPYIRLVHWKNTGAAFGMLQNVNWLFMIISSVVCLAIIYYFRAIPRHDRLLRFVLALTLGGALGNLLDRFHQGHVTDFISVGSFPVFNVADASISIGVTVILLASLLEKKQQFSQAADEPLKAETEDSSAASGGEAAPLMAETEHPAVDEERQA